MVYLKKILAILLFCKECDLKNVLLHMPLGVIIIGIAVGLYLAGFPSLAAGFLISFSIGFMMYELAERPVLHDKAFPDIQGYLWGSAIASSIVVIVRLA
jgi:hypothetical protein